jgi:predicted MFS family arabinose efflux permease
MQLTGQPLSVISGVLEQECVAFRRAWSQRTHMSGKALLKRRALLQGVVELASGNASTRDLTETPLFEEVERSESAARAPLVEVVRTARRQLLLGIGSRIGSDCIFFVFTFFLLVYLPRLGVPSAVGLEAILAAAIAQIIGIPLSGALSDRIGRRPVLIGGAATTIIWAYVFFMLLHTKVPALIIFASFVGMFFHAGMWGPLGSFLPEMFETRVRCTGASLSFQLAGLLGNALIPIVASQLVIKFDSPWPVAVYLTFWLVVMIACVAAVPETVHADLANIAVRSKGQQRRP